mmetsp:Transcript_23098/g.22976  ORF Transcript_23098/g.22976 Transcript_23098/m.22976 type:complete len:227 (-) Transcript_23098:26-706(-)
MENNFTLHFQADIQPQYELELHVFQPINVIVIPDWEMASPMSEYCMCNQELNSSRVDKNVISPQEHQPTRNSSISSQIIEEMKPSFAKAERNRRRRAARLTNTQRTVYLRRKLVDLYRELDAIDDQDITVVYGQSKIASISVRPSNRRSRFVGVFKNTSKWQALIDISSWKTYIQTYSTEQEAARAYDLMSLLLKGLRALTNFDYSKADILELFTTHSDIIDKFCS